MRYVLLKHCRPLYIKSVLWGGMPRQRAAIHHAQPASRKLVSPTLRAAALPYLSHVLGAIPTNLESSTRLFGIFARSQQSLCVTES